jgi:hypothetical protein
MEKINNIFIRCIYSLYCLVYIKDHFFKIIYINYINQAMEQINNIFICSIAWFLLKITSIKDNFYKLYKPSNGKNK